MCAITLAWRRIALPFGFGLIGALSFAQPFSPVYFNTFHDAVTGDNAFFSNGRHWDIDPGADSYQHDVYERPVVQTFNLHGGVYSTSEYFEYLDIVKAHVGHDDRYFYVAIDLFGRDKSTQDGVNTEVGLLERYGFRLGPHKDGRDAALFVVDQPEAASSNNTVYSRLKTFGYYDSDGDVGGRGLFEGGPTGRSVTKSDNPKEEHGLNGFDEDFISDGRLSNGQTVLWSRLDPDDDTVVEMALDYRRLGLTTSDILAMEYLEIEAIKGGPKDPQNYLWNDKYTKSEAGSPYYGGNGLSEFGTQGLGNIYELDTLLIPEPGTMLALGAGLALLASRRRRR